MIDSMSRISVTYHRAYKLSGRVMVVGDYVKFVGSCHRGKILSTRQAGEGGSEGRTAAAEEDPVKVTNGNFPYPPRWRFVVSFADISQVK